LKKLDSAENPIWLKSYWLFRITRYD